jgi:hypothetical protein
MKSHNFILFFSLFLILLGFDSIEAKAQMPKYIMQSLDIDSIYASAQMPVIFADEIFVFPQKTFKNNRERKRYNKLRHNFKKVYPYALLIEEELNAIEKVVHRLPTEEAKEAYIKKKEKELMDKYKDTMKKLTMSQGFMLVKLIDRETGNTAYHLIEELKGSVVAFFWQGIALLFKNDLKAKYDAEVSDREIEELVVLWEHGCL